jgi:Secretion system C-terminal sorting domain
MIKKIFYTSLAVFSFANANAQTPCGSPSQVLQTPLLESTTEATLQGAQWNIVIETEEAETKLYPDVHKLMQGKKELALLRDQQIIVPSANTIKQTRTATPIVGTNFKGNKLHSLVPTDNSMAISKDGKIVSVDNWNLTYADKTGAIIKDSIVWNDFLSNNPSLLNGKYDPRVVYDNVHDRFVVLVLHAPGNIANTKIVLAFSKTNDPMQGWNIYTLPGNPLNDSSWADYPNIGINNNEVFINVNLFKGAPTYAYNQSVIYQANLANGYGGAAALNYKVWSGHIRNSISDTMFTIVPAPQGMGDASGPHMWFVSNNYFSDTLVNAFQITKELFDPTAQLLTYSYKVPRYQYCADGYIKDPAAPTKDSISTGSSVIQNAFYLDSTLHYTFNGNIGTGWCGIQYGRIDLRKQTSKVKSFGNIGSYLSYPAVASFGFSAKDKSAVICYLQADTNTFPQVCAVAVDDAMDFSTQIVLKKGDTSVNMLYQPSFNQAERWGDYTGIQRRYNTKVPEVWCAGGYAGNNSRKASFNTWITQLTNGAMPLDIAPESNIKNTASIYPNPGNQQFTFSWFQATEAMVHITIINAQGQLVKQIANTEMETGNHTLHFNKGALPVGHYTLLCNSKVGKQQVQFVVE